MSGYCLGLDLTTPRWAGLRWKSGTEKPEPLPALDIPGWGGRDLASIVAERLLIGPGQLARAPESIGETALGPVLDAAGGFVDKKLLSHYRDDSTAIALAFPAALPPIARRQLPRLVNHPSLALAQANGPADLYAVEAPVALALDFLCGEDRVQESTSFWLFTLTGRPGAPEVAGVWVVCKPKDCHDVEIRWIAHAPGDLPPDGLIKAEDACWVVHSGIEAGQVAALARALSLDPDDLDRVMDLGSEAVARGAVRYASTLLPRYAILGRRLLEVAVTSVASAPVGLLGLDSSGREWFWRRLFAAGEPLEGLATLESATPPPRKEAIYLSLAENRDPSLVDALWIAQPDRHRIHRYEVLRVPTTASPPEAIERFRWSFPQKWLVDLRVPRWEVTVRPSLPADPLSLARKP